MYDRYPHLTAQEYSIYGPDMLTYNKFVQRLDDAVNHISDDRLLDIVFIVKSILYAVGFIALVAVWDTLPSRSPITNVEVSVDTGSERSFKFAVIDESYEVRKEVDYRITRKLRNRATGEVHDLQGSSGSFVRGPKKEHLIVPIKTIQTGKWCVESKLTWENGLSLMRHIETLPIQCFEVNNGTVN